MIGKAKGWYVESSHAGFASSRPSATVQRSFLARYLLCLLIQSAKRVARPYANGVSVLVFEELNRRDRFGRLGRAETEEAALRSFAATTR